MGIYRVISDLGGVRRRCHLHTPKSGYFHGDSKSPIKGEGKQDMLKKLREPVNGLTHLGAAIAAALGLVGLWIIGRGSASKKSR